MNTIVLTKQGTPPRTFVQWLSAILRAVADSFDPPVRRAPTVEEIKREMTRDVELALLDAEAEEDRCTHTVQMLRRRLARLRS